MKSSVIIVILVLFSFQVCSAQEVNEKIKAAWGNLTTQIQNEADIAERFVNMCSKAPNADKAHLDSVKIFSARLYNYLDTMMLRDSLSAADAFAKKKKLAMALSRTWTSSETNPDPKVEAELNGLWAQWMESQKKIEPAKLNYNNLCKDYKRPDLCFGPANVGKPLPID